MFESLRNRFKSDEDKRQEMINAYLDDALSPRDKTNFEDQLADDRNLRSELEQYQWLRQSINQLPRKKAPRNFTLDPVVYGKPASRFPVKIYPALRTATVLAGLIFVFLIGLDLISSSQDPPTAISSFSQQAGEAADVDLAADAAVEKEALESAELPVEALLPTESVVEKEAVIQELETEIEIRKAATQESSAFIIELESEEAAIAAESIAEESAIGAAAPEESPPSLDEVEESFEDAVTDVESDSVLPSRSGPLSGQVGGSPTIIITIAPTRSESEPPDEEIAETLGDTAQEMDPELARTPSESTSDEAPTVGATSLEATSAEATSQEAADLESDITESASPDPGMGDGEQGLLLAEKPLIADRSKAVEQRNYPTLRLLEIIVGIGLVLLIGITILIRSRSRNYY